MYLFEAHLEIFINIFSSRVGLCLGRLANAPTNPLAWFMIFPVKKTWCYLLPNNLKKFQREFQASIKWQSTAKIIYLLKHFVHNDSTLRAMFTFTVLITGAIQKLKTNKKTNEILKKLTYLIPWWVVCLLFHCRIFLYSCKFNVNPWIKWNSSKIFRFNYAQLNLFIEEVNSCKYFLKVMRPINARLLNTSKCLSTKFELIWDTVECYLFSKRDTFQNIKNY